MDQASLPFTLNHVVSVLNANADAILRARFDATFSQFRFLDALRAGRMSLTDLAACLDVSPAAVSKRAPWFEERGLVRVQHDPSHGRRVLVSLTAKGSRLAQRMSDELDTSFRDAFADMPDLDLERLSRDLDRVLERLATDPRSTATGERNDA